MIVTLTALFAFLRDKCLCKRSLIRFVAQPAFKFRENLFTVPQQKGGVTENPAPGAKQGGEKSVSLLAGLYFLAEIFNVELV